MQPVLIFFPFCATMMCKKNMLWHMMKGAVLINRHHLNKAVQAAVFAALCCLATIVVQVPAPLVGYLNLGDCVVLTGAFLLGPLYGALAAGIGSALADLLAGYVQYVPATLVIKGLVALVAALLFSLLCKRLRMPALPARILAAVLGECIMVFGYFAYEALALGYGAGALVGMPMNVLQAVLGVVSATVLTSLLVKIPYLGRKE
jgi:uncharacterized membrane protein